MSFRVYTLSVGADISAAFTAAKVAASPSVYTQIVRAATFAIQDAAELLKVEGRANIAAAGFSRKWQNAWRVNVYPREGGFSLDAAAFAFHKIPYSLVFEEGARIRAGNGLMWIPLSTVPKDGRRRSFTPSRIQESGVKLFSINRPGKKPLLATQIRASGRAADTTVSTVRGRKSVAGRLISMSRLRKGTKGKRGHIETVPLFVGVNMVTIQKRFDLRGVADRVSSRLGTLYADNIGAGV